MSRQCEGRQAPEHDVQVGAAAAQGEVHVSAVALALQEGRDKGFAEDNVDQDGRRAAQDREVQLEAERVAHTVHIALAVELRAEDARSAEPAEDRQAVDHHDLVGDGGGGDGFRPEAADHDVVEQGDEIRDELLDDDRDQEHEYAPVKGFVADKP